MKRKIVAPVIVMASLLAGMTFLSYGLRTTNNQTIEAICGIGLTVLFAATLWPIFLLLRVILQAVPIVEVAAVRRRSLCQMWIVAGLIVALDIWPIFDLFAFPGERALDVRFLWAIQIVGAIAFAVVIYRRFRFLRIIAKPQQSAEIEKRFWKWESLFFRVLWGAFIIGPTYRDLRRDMSQGNKTGLVYFVVPFVAILGLLIFKRVRSKQKKVSETVPG